MKNWQAEVSALVDGGYAADTAEGRALRKQILESGSTVKKYLAARPQETVHGAREPSVAGVMSDLTALMRSEPIDMAQARHLRAQIIESGGTVKEYLLAKGAYGMPSTTDVFRSAANLVKLAGSKERAIEAINAFDSLEASAPEAE
jgi:hypothetical protein